MPEPHDHQWQDTGFAAVEDCAVPGCEAVRSEPNDKPEREWYRSALGLGQTNPDHLYAGGGDATRWLTHAGASEVAPTPCPSCGAPTWDGLHRNGFRECVMAEVETS